MKTLDTLQSTSKKVLFLDIETTGLNPGEHGIWQVGSCLSVQSDRLELLHLEERLFHPWQKEKVRRHVEGLLESVDLLVAHNVEFEQKFLRACGLESFPDAYCTMLSTTGLCKIDRYVWDSWEGDYVRVGYKWPKLTEAIDILVGEKYGELLNVLGDGKYHDALWDVLQVVRVYAVLKGLEVRYDGLKVRKVHRLRKWLYRRRYDVFYEPYDNWFDRRLNNIKLTLFYKWQDLKWRIRQILGREPDF